MFALQYPEDGHIKSKDLSSQDIIAGLLSDFWEKILCYDAVGSTNELAMDLSPQYPKSRIAIIADSQALGKGRLGRVWVSPPGCNIYMSAVLYPSIALRDAPFLTVAAALACASSLRNKSGLKVSIKWPNDLMVCGKKIGGILTELKSGHGRIYCVVMGVGININSRLMDFPEELSSRVTSVKEETGKYFSRSIIIAEILNELERWYGNLQSGDRLPLLKEWKKLSSTLGNKVRVTLGSEILSGYAEDINERGMLILKLASGKRRIISAGDLTELR